MDERRFDKPIRRAGYSISIAVNLVGLWIANSILAWGWFPWLTDDFNEVLPWVNASFIASVVANLLFLFDDRRTIRRAADLVTTGIALMATIRMLTVFPFDFDAYSFDWAVLVRVLLSVVVFAMAVGLVVNTATLIRDTVTRTANG